MLNFEYRFNLANYILKLQQFSDNLITHYNGFLNLVSNKIWRNEEEKYKGDTNFSDLNFLDAPEILRERLVRT